MRWTRRTIHRPAEFKGPGLHAGEPVRAIIHPAGEGIVFSSGGEKVEAVAENVSETVRCTRLGPVAVIEHLMAALAICGVTDALIEVEGAELPALDGSAAIFCEGFLEAGTEELGEAEGPDLFKRALVREGEAVCAAGSGEGRWSYLYSTADRWPGDQMAEVRWGRDDLVSQVAPARTFAFDHEVEPMRALRLGMGLTEESCLILGADGPRQAPRFENEPARHKLLDLIGDLALTGIPPSALNVRAERSGHRLNVAAALKIRQLLKLAPIEAEAGA
jgi:UDP-3-O-acyl-N-acetylglucosamine deacetylase